MTTSPVVQSTQRVLEVVVKEIDSVYSDESNFTGLTLEQQFNVLSLLSKVITLQNSLYRSNREPDNILFSITLQRSLSEIFDRNIKQNDYQKGERSSDPNSTRSSRRRGPKRT